ncbi:MAG: hypothetical protein JWN01_428 [Patescibacteria group bacterium]|nr:hypothetical protein [Patescibacteria group bacterium]
MRLMAADERLEKMADRADSPRPFEFDILEAPSTTSLKQALASLLRVTGLGIADVDLQYIAFDGPKGAVFTLLVTRKSAM